jgi:ABC-type glycerol-3-phosphate transport system substrate-binding protein
MLRKSLGLMGSVLALVAAGCSSADSPAQQYAKAACAAYQEGGRVQVSATAEQSSAIHDLARSNARAAAAFDSRWTSLSADMRAALDLQEELQNPPADNVDLFFEIDKRVQNDCSDAGRDIGDLKP